MPARRVTKDREPKLQRSSSVPRSGHPRSTETSSRICRVRRSAWCWSRARRERPRAPASCASGRNEGTSSTHPHRPRFLRSSTRPWSIPTAEAGVAATRSRRSLPNLALSTARRKRSGIVASASLRRVPRPAALAHPVRFSRSSASSRSRRTVGGRGSTPHRNAGSRVRLAAGRGRGPGPFDRPRRLESDDRAPDRCALSRRRDASRCDRSPSVCRDLSRRCPCPRPPHGRRPLACLRERPGSSATGSSRRGRLYVATDDGMLHRTSRRETPIPGRRRTGAAIWDEPDDILDLALSRPQESRAQPERTAQKTSKKDRPANVYRGECKQESK